MSQRHHEHEKEKRWEVYRSYEKLFASAPIRLMSRTVSTMRSLGHDDLATAIGDMDWRTVPADDPEDPNLRQEWGDLLESAFEHMGGWLRQLSANPMGYNLDSLGYSTVIRGWSEMWKHQLGLEFNNDPSHSPEVFVFHGGNQAIQAAILGIAEARRNISDSTEAATILVPIPTFSCPLDQIALQGIKTWLLPSSRTDMDPDPTDIASIPDDLHVDGVYMMPINNPTGRTLPPEKLKAFISAVLDRWPQAGIILDSVYVRIHPRDRELLSWYEDDPRFKEALIFVDSLSKSHGVTGLRAGALLSKSSWLTTGVLRYAQNILAGPSNAMQAITLSLLSPFVTGDRELAEQRIRLQQRIGRHLQRRRRLLLRRAFVKHRDLLSPDQPMLPDPTGFDWEGSMYADLQLSESCVQKADDMGVSPTVAFYLESGIAGVPLEGFCSNPNLCRHHLLLNEESPQLKAFIEQARHFVRLSFGMTPPPRDY